MQMSSHVQVIQMHAYSGTSATSSSSTTASLPAKTGVAARFDGIILEEIKAAADAYARAIQDVTRVGQRHILQASLQCDAKYMIPCV